MLTIQLVFERWYPDTTEITILCSKQTQRHFWSVLTCSKNTLFRAYCMPMYACQLWSKYTQTSMKRLRAAYNNAYRIMHYIPRNASVRPHQVSHCVRTFDAMLRNNLYRFFMRCTSSSNFFIRSLQMPDAFYKSSFFLNYSTLLYGDQIKCSSCPWSVSKFASHQYCFCVVKICGHCVHTKQ